MRLRHSLQLLVASLSLGSLLLLGCSQNRQFGEEDQSHLPISPSQFPVSFAMNVVSPPAFSRAIWIAADPP
ncbi:hypothetical protein QPK87_08465 [Kamptonema cortianum]|nr:hypothetical protein [Desertifilum sp.]MDI9639335.1 hypothetical protein [Geitlerinema splendidum]MDK3156610.1 hypothetical protein [Kamptonema cortianum]MDL5047055.1 hypothetical protein [Oscillatoria amoena NRMC-F 0135]